MHPSTSTKPRPSSLGSTMALLCRRVMIFSMSLAVMGCAGIRVEHLTDETFVPRRAISQIEWLNQEPIGPYFEVARIVVSSANLSPESLRRALLDKAYALGADALV